MYEDLLRHKPEGIGNEIREYIENVVFEDAHYIFYKTKGRRQDAYCTKCRHEFSTSGLRHNEINECPYCYEKLKSKSANKGRASLVHKATLLWYEKSTVDNYSVIARGFTVTRDYSKDDFKDSYLEQAFYYFSENESRMLKKDWWNSRWVATNSIFRFNINSLANMPFYCSKENIINATKDTCLKYSSCEEFRKQFIRNDAWRALRHSELLKYFEFYLKYPQIEKLIKIGLGNLIVEKLEGGVLGTTVNWRAKEVHNMLKITKGELREIVKKEIRVTPLFLKLYQLNSKNSQKLNISEIKDLEYVVMHPGYVEGLSVVLRYTSMRKLYRYLNKQYKTKQYKSMNLILSDWKDYIFDAQKLGIDLNLESNSMPKDLYTTHQNTIKQIKYNNNLEIMRKAKERAKDLQKYHYKSNGLLIRAPKDSQEIIEEGKIQHICVGGYAERHANGITTILFIRKVENPNVPYFTVEIRDNKVVQVRGKRNCDTTKEIDKFIKNFEKSRLSKKKNNKKKNKVA